MKDKINVLSLFDGISCGQVALERVGIKVNNYFASEIDKYAIQITQKNYPNTIQLGDILNWKDWNIDWSSIDLLIGGSPCFTAGTLVMTDKGFKNIEDIKVGDNVLTHKSRYKKVLKVGNKIANKIYNIKGFGFDNIGTTSEHPFYAREMFRKWDNKNRTSIRLFSDAEWIKTKDLNKKHYLGVTYNSTNLKEIYDKSFWKFVGRFTADGWLVKTKRKNRKDSYSYKVMLCCGKSELDECKELLDNLRYNYNITEEKTVFKFCISNKKLLEYLESIKRGALNKRVHPDIWLLTHDLKKSFLEGYIDGDGSLYKRNYKITTISKELAYGIKVLITEVYNRPVSLYLQKRSPKYKIDGRIVNQHDTYQIIFKRETGKQDKAFCEDNYSWNPINNINIHDINTVVYNLEVEEDNSYTANSIVVHNCQGFSFAGKQLNFSDPRSKLFFIYVDILNHIKKYNPNVKFLLENVKMKKEYENVITNCLSVEPVLINSNLVSAQNRNRLYWANWDFEQPEDKGILLKDILIDGKGVSVENQGKLNLGLCNKSHCLMARDYKGFGNQRMTGVMLSTGNIRKMFPIEYERLQTVPDNYTDIVSNTQRYKALGNGWTVDVIAHIFRGLK